MQVTQSNFDPESGAASAMRLGANLQVTKVFATPRDANAILHRMAIRIMAAVAEGERDPVRLKALAMDGLEA